MGQSLLFQICLALGEGLLTLKNLQAYSLENFVDLWGAGGFEFCPAAADWHCFSPNQSLAYKFSTVLNGYKNNLV